jgi:hypothetical protein
MDPQERVKGDPKSAKEKLARGSAQPVEKARFGRENPKKSKEIQALFL